MGTSQFTKRIYTSTYSLQAEAEIGAQLYPLSVQESRGNHGLNFSINRRDRPSYVKPSPAPQPMDSAWLNSGCISPFVQGLHHGLSQTQAIEICDSRPGVSPALLSAVWATLAQQSRAASALPMAYLDVGHSPLLDIQQDIFDAFYQTPKSFKATPNQVAQHLSQLKAWLLLENIAFNRSDLQRLLKSIPGCKVIFTSRKNLLHKPEIRELLATVVSDSRYRSHLRQLQKSAAQLSALESKALSYLAQLHSIPIQSQTLASLLKTGSLKLAMDNLIQRGLVQRSQAGYLQAGYSQAGYLQAAPTAHCTDVEGRISKGRVLSRVLSWIQTSDHDLPALDAEARLIYWAIAQTYQNGDWKTLLALLRSTEGVFIQRKWWGRWAQLLFWAVEAARFLGDKSAIAWAHHQLGSRALCLGEPASAQAHLSRALALRQACGDAVGAAATSRHVDILISPTAQTSRLISESASAASPSGAAPAGSGPGTPVLPAPVFAPAATMAPALIKSAATVLLMTGAGSGVLWLGAQQIQARLNPPGLEARATATSLQSRSQASEPAPPAAPELSTADDAANNAPGNGSNQPDAAAEPDNEAQSLVAVVTESVPKRSVVRFTTSVRPAKPVEVELTEQGEPKPALLPSTQPAAAQPPVEPSPPTVHCLVGRWTSDLSDPMRGDFFMGDRAILNAIAEGLNSLSQSGLGGQDFSYGVGHLGQMLMDDHYRDRTLGRRDLIDALENPPPQGNPRPLLNISIQHAATQGKVGLTIAEDGSLVSTYDNLSHRFDISHSLQSDRPSQTHQIHWALNGKMTGQARFSEQNDQIAYSNLRWNLEPKLSQDQVAHDVPEMREILQEVSQSLKPQEILQPAAYRCNETELELKMNVAIGEQVLSFIRRYRRIG